MLVKEFFQTRLDGINLYRTFSDSGFFIKKINTDEIYKEAIDIEYSNYIYEETDILIPTEEDEIQNDELL